MYDEPEHAICIEPQSGPPDAFNIGGTEHLEVDRPLEHWMKWRWWYVWRMGKSVSHERLIRDGE